MVFPERCYDWSCYSLFPDLSQNSRENAERWETIEHRGHPSVTRMRSQRTLPGQGHKTHTKEIVRLSLKQTNQMLAVFLGLLALPSTAEYSISVLCLGADNVSDSLSASTLVTPGMWTALSHRFLSAHQFLIFHLLIQIF